ncbi:hypothetical protein U1Q18_050666 [Sarracenia purpurea var. burkii]
MKNECVGDEMTVAIVIFVGIRRELPYVRGIGADWVSFGKVNVEKDEGSVQSAPVASVGVKYPPIVTLNFGNSLNPKNIKEGDDVYFECKVRSNPTQHRITWFHNGFAKVLNGFGKDSDWIVPISYAKVDFA